MSLCPMSWKNIKKLSRTIDMQLVHAAAQNSGEIIAIDVEGNAFVVDRKTQPWTVTPAVGFYSGTTTSVMLKGGPAHSEQWRAEINRRIAEIT